MNKFVIFNYGDGYQSCIINAIKDDIDAYHFLNFKSNVMRKLFETHNSWPVNKNHELPFKRLWFKRVMRGIDVDNNDTVYFLLYENFHLTYSRKFLQYLKKNYVNAKFCYVFSNPAGAYNLAKVKYIKDYLDGIITFNKKDAEEHNFLYCPNQPYKVPLYPLDDKKSDVFFIGADKGRLSILLNLYERLSVAGIICDFYIVGVPEEKQKFASGITYNKRLTYEEVLQKVASTRCVLEVLQSAENYVSIRTYEALQYHTKLLTSSQAARKFEFYNEDVIQIFSDVEDINVDFIKQSVDDKSFPDEKFGSSEPLKKFLIENVK